MNDEAMKMARRIAAETKFGAALAHPAQARDEMREKAERLREALEDTQATLSAVKAEATVDGGGTCRWIAEKLHQQMIDNRAALSATPAPPVDETDRLQHGALDRFIFEWFNERDPKAMQTCLEEYDARSAALRPQEGEAIRG